MGLLLVLLPTWNLGCLYQLVSQWCILIHSLRLQLTSQSITLSRATTLLQQRIQSQRAYCTGRYDVYLPFSLFGTTTTTTTTSNHNHHHQKRRQQPRQQPQKFPQQQQAAILFIPSATVSYEAYSEVAGRLFNTGIVVAVFSLEPIRLTNHQLGTDATAIS